MPRVASSPFIIEQSSSPLMPGMRTSRTIASGRVRRTDSSAVSAFAASSTSMSTTSKVVRKSARNAASSSTMRRRIGWLPKFGVTPSIGFRPLPL